ncbi:MAG: hypothetical protein M3Q69_15620 [Acidobacteriota bacterium]|nr:hypothetical protein [Acidobacteriota bacterium]
MAGDALNFWDVLDEAEEAVERWPWWKQRYKADLASTGDSSMDFDDFASVFAFDFGG